MSSEPGLAGAIECAHALLGDDRPEELLAFVEGAIERFPADPELRLMYGIALVPFRPEEASWQIAMAISFDSEDPVRLTRAASLLLNLGEVEAAKSYAAHAAELAPPNFLFAPELMNLSGRLATVEHDDALAEEALKAAFDAEPTREAFARDLANLLVEQGRSAEALDVLDRSLRSPLPPWSAAAMKGHEQLKELRAQIAEAH